MQMQAQAATLPALPAGYGAAALPANPAAYSPLLNVAGLVAQHGGGGLAQVTLALTLTRTRD